MSDELTTIRNKLIDYEDKIIKQYIKNNRLRDLNTNIDTNIDTNINTNINTNIDTNIDTNIYLKDNTLKLEDHYNFILEDLVCFYYDYININNNFNETNINNTKELFKIILERILLGEEVIKAKIKMDYEKYDELIKKKKIDEIYKLLENKVVEDNILIRLRNKKLENYNDGIKDKISSLYKDFIIPYTKSVQIIHCIQDNNIYEEGTSSK